MIIECIRFYGFDILYLPHTQVDVDRIFLEDTLKKYENAIPLEAYLERVDGYGGDGELMQKFGIEIRDTATFVVARSRWESVIGQGRGSVLQLPNRPAEGDILYMPLTKSYFEIKRVESHDPFYQLGKLYVYKLQCELIQYSSEMFDTGHTEVDKIEIDFSLDLENYGMLLEDGSLLLIDSSQYEDDLTGSLILETIPEVIDQDPQGDNETFTDVALSEDILDFSESNPFGEIISR